MRTRWDRGRGNALSLFALTAAIACAFGTSVLPAAGQATKQKPAATEIGVTPTEIHIAVIADVDNPIAPNLAIGPRDAVLGFARYINASCATKNQCLAGRKLVVDFYDSHANPSETRNAEIQACQNDLAMVGTTGPHRRYEQPGSITPPSQADRGVCWAAWSASTVMFRHEVPAPVIHWDVAA